MKKIVITKVMNNYEVVLNVGKNDGITEKNRFVVLGESNPVIDPITNEILGTIPYEKAKLRVKQLYTNLTICEDIDNGVYYEKSLLNSSFSPIIDATADLFGKREYVHNKLNIDIDDLTESELEQSIKIGDEVKVID